MSDKDPTRNLPDDGDHSILDAFLDGQLSAKERAAFERDGLKKPSLAAEARAQSRVNQTLLHSFGPPIPAAAMAALHHAIDKGVPTATGPAKLGSAGKLILTAAILLGAGSLLYILMPDGRYKPAQNAAALYNDAVAHGFTPQIPLTTDSAVSEVMESRVHRSVRVGQLPSDVQLVGMSSCDCLNPRTAAVFATVCGRPVVAFIDSLQGAAHPAAPWGSGLHVYRRDLGDTVVYELSPLNHPSLLNSFYSPPEGHCHSAP